MANTEMTLLGEWRIRQCHLSAKRGMLLALEKQQGCPIWEGIQSWLWLRQPHMPILFTNAKEVECPLQVIGKVMSIPVPNLLAPCHMWVTCVAWCPQRCLVSVWIWLWPRRQLHRDTTQLEQWHIRPVGAMAYKATSPEHEEGNGASIGNSGVAQSSKEYQASCQSGSSTKYMFHYVWNLSLNKLNSQNIIPTQWKSIHYWKTGLDEIHPQWRQLDEWRQVFWLWHSRMMLVQSRQSEWWKWCRQQEARGQVIIICKTNQNQKRIYILPDDVVT